MYLGIDVGGTKTLVAALDDQGVIKEKSKIPTAKDYSEFIKSLNQAVASFDHKEFVAAGIGLPATKIDRANGVALHFGNLPWTRVPVQADLEKICDCPVVIENDAKMGALSEYMLLKDKFSSVLYVTISTGIGYGLVTNGVIDENVGSAGGRTILLDYKGQLTPWEDFASGRAIVERFGKKAADINDEPTWQIISRDLAKGFIHLIAIMQPDAIVIGGSVGNYFDRFSKYLEKDIEAYKIPMVDLPALVQAGRPDEAVIFGCYDLAKQVYPHASTNN